jgi:FAD/FMN-containing dehydrogenase
MGPWTNWAGNVTFEATEWHSPRTEEEIVAAVRRAHELHASLRVAGIGHTFNSMMSCDGGIGVLLKRYTKVLKIDREHLSVTVQAGITLTMLLEQLEDVGLTLDNVPIITSVTVGGALATCTHGSGRHHTSLSSHLISCRLVTGVGEVITVTEGGVNADLLPAVRVSLGALGVISTATLRVVPAFKLHLVEQPMALYECLGQIHALADRYEYFKTWWVPHTGMTHNFCITRDERALPPADPPQSKEAERVSHWLEKTLSGSKFVEDLFGLVAADPTTMPFVNQALRSAQYVSRTHCDASDAILTNRHWRSESAGCRFDVMEYAIPVEHVEAAVGEPTPLAPGSSPAVQRDKCLQVLARIR